MDTNNMKNMIVIKNLPSNIAEEAIVILKPNIKLKSLDLAGMKKENIKTQNEQNSKKYIINEAQMIISNYLSNIEKQKKKEFRQNKKLELKYKSLKITSILLGILLIISFLL